MSPDSTDTDPKSLPRSFRGYNRQATEELFRRVAWDYGVLAGEHRKLRKVVEEMNPPARRKGDLIEDAHSVLVAAQKAARELRESARAECEQALRKAKGRAAEIEAEASRAATEAAAVLAGAAELRSALQQALRRFEHGEPLPSAAPRARVEPEVAVNGGPAGLRTANELVLHVPEADDLRPALDDPATP